MARLLHKPYVNGVTLRGQNLPLKCCQDLEILTLLNGTRSLFAENMNSVGQLAAKLLAVKVRVFKKKSATLAIPAKVCASVISPGSRPPQVKSFPKFDGLQLCSPLAYRSQIFSI